jgi:TrmH family RNA methyltransferase
MPRTSTTLFALDDTSLIDSLRHPQSATIRSLLTLSAETARHSILVDDEDNILRALNAGIAVRSIFQSDSVTLSDDLRQRLPSTARHYTVARRTCTKLFGNDKVSRVFAVADSPPPQSLDALSATERDIVVLDGISIAGNIGAIVRTAVALAAGGIALVNTRAADPFDRRVIRASRGFLFALPLVTTTTEELIDFCSMHDRPLLVATPAGERSLDEIPSSRPAAMVFGSEKASCSRQLADAATLRVTIPTIAAVESLNVAAAAAITLHSRYRFNSARLHKERARTPC